MKPVLRSQLTRLEDKVPQVPLPLDPVSPCIALQVLVDWVRSVADDRLNFGYD
jgi:hypothetical protein